MDSDWLHSESTEYVNSHFVYLRIYCRYDLNLLHNSAYKWISLHFHLLFLCSFFFLSLGTWAGNHITPNINNSNKKKRSKCLKKIKKERNCVIIYFPFSALFDHSINKPTRSTFSLLSPHSAFNSICSWHCGMFNILPFAIFILVQFLVLQWHTLHTGGNHSCILIYLIFNKRRNRKTKATKIAGNEQQSCFHPNELKLQNYFSVLVLAWPTERDVTTLSRSGVWFSLWWIIQRIQALTGKNTSRISWSIEAKLGSQDIVLLLLQWIQKYQHKWCMSFLKHHMMREGRQGCRL